jgi:hypothetical protein
MRDIEFKAKTVNTGDWVFSMTIGQGTIKRKRDNYYFELSVGAWVGVIPETIGEYTGLKDIKKVKVFEGDLVTNENAGCNLLVVFENGKFALKPLIEEGNHPLALADIGHLEFMWVVGNIHDKTN